MSKLTEKRKVRKCMRNAYAHRDLYTQKFIKNSVLENTVYSKRPVGLQKTSPQKNMRQKNLQIQLEFVLYCPSIAGLCTQ